jgi:hypothetical protein
VPTATLSHVNPGQRSIDHIAVPEHWAVWSAQRHSASVDGKRLSDHDAYTVRLDITPAPRRPHGRTA